MDQVSLPYGSFSEAILREATSAGYTTVLTCEPEVIRPPVDEVGCVGRFKVTPDDWMIEFRLAALGSCRWRKMIRRRQRDRGAPASSLPVTNSQAPQTAQQVHSRGTS
jgi:hypothetical protein